MECALRRIWLTLSESVQTPYERRRAAAQVLLSENGGLGQGWGVLQLANYLFTRRDGSSKS